MHKCTTLTCQYSCKIFSRKKSNRDTVQKQHTNKLNRSHPFYLLSIRSKKIDSYEFHKQIQDFELPTSWNFFEGQKKQGSITKTYRSFLKYFTPLILVITTF